MPQNINKHEQMHTCMQTDRNKCMHAHTKNSSKWVFTLPSVCDVCMCMQSSGWFLVTYSRRIGLLPLSLSFYLSLSLDEDGWGIIPLGRYYGLLSILFLLQLQTARDTREPIAFTACPIHHLFSSSARPSFVWVSTALLAAPWARMSLPLYNLFAIHEWLCMPRKWGDGSGF